MTGLSILVASYRDIRHPEMGGAEVIIHEIYKRLAARGHKVTYLTGAWPGAAKEEEIDGIAIHRVGSTYTFNWVVPRAYRAIRKQGFDVIVEDLNKIPLFGPWFQNDAPVLANVPHLFGTTVFREAPWPIGLYVYLHERLIPLCYRRSLFQVLSETTRDDLIERGIDPARIHVVRCGIDHETYRPPDRRGTPEPIFLYLGRLKKYKGIELPIKAMPRILKSVPDARYWIVGEGDYRGSLEAMIRDSNLAGRVELLGYRDGAAKLDILRRARVLVYTSPKEGWGLSVIEANAMGVPVVASNSPGLRESVRDEVTGFLVPHGDIAALGDRLSKLLSDDDLWVRMGQAGIAWADQFNWGRMADETEDLLRRAVRDWREGDQRNAR